MTNTETDIIQFIQNLIPQETIEVKFPSRYSTINNGFPEYKVIISLTSGQEFTGYLYWNNELKCFVTDPMSEHSTWERLISEEILNFPNGGVSIRGNNSTISGLTMNF